MLHDRRRALGVLAITMLRLSPLGVVVAAGSNALLGRALKRRFARPRRVRPDDLPPIPWIGHC